jgi:hypothetical protein
LPVVTAGPEFSVTANINNNQQQKTMAHKIIEFLISLMGVIGIFAFFFALIFVVMDVIEVYLRIRERVLRHDFLKRGDME